MAGSDNIRHGTGETADAAGNRIDDNHDSENPESSDSADQILRKAARLPRSMTGDFRGREIYASYYPAN